MVHCNQLTPIPCKESACGDHMLTGDELLSSVQQEETELVTQPSHYPCSKCTLYVNYLFFSSRPLRKCHKMAWLIVRALTTIISSLSFTFYSCMFY